MWVLCCSDAGPTTCLAPDVLCVGMPQAGFLRLPRGGRAPSLSNTCGTRCWLGHKAGTAKLRDGPAPGWRCQVLSSPRDAVSVLGGTQWPLSVLRGGWGGPGCCPATLNTETVSGLLPAGHNEQWPGLCAAPCTQQGPWCSQGLPQALGPSGPGSSLMGPWISGRAWLRTLGAASSSKVTMLGVQLGAGHGELILEPGRSAGVWQVLIL